MADRLEYRFRPVLRCTPGERPVLALIPPPGFPSDGGIPTAVEATRRLTDARSRGWRRRYIDRTLDVPPLPWFSTCAPRDLAFLWINMLKTFARAPVTSFHD